MRMALASPEGTVSNPALASRRVSSSSIRALAAVESGIPEAPATGDSAIRRISCARADPAQMAVAAARVAEITRMRPTAEDAFIESPFSERSWNGLEPILAQLKDR